ncbi:hypothetical protein ApAK_02675 [Thermoplasmatales archaeon AK]|nr:hypothetical protein [Thermoplasmatales archaeon AK]
MKHCSEDFVPPFVRFTPRTMKMRECTVRTPGPKWASLRYFVDTESGSFRVKEFFLDWFFIGFPKCLLKDFSSSYSETSSVKGQGTVAFIGLNYRGNLSLSATILGTQVEIESPPGSMSQEDLSDLFLDLGYSSDDYVRLSGVPFAERSFFVRNPVSGWYEEERINRLRWQSLRMSVRSPLDDNFDNVSVGIHPQEPDHNISVIASDDFSRVIWLESAHRLSSLTHPYYRVRRGTGFYDKEFRQDGFTAIARSASGPSVIQYSAGDFVRTCAFSPGLRCNEESFALSPQSVKEFCESLLEKIRTAVSKSC